MAYYYSSWFRHWNIGNIFYEALMNLPNSMKLQWKTENLDHIIPEFVEFLEKHTQYYKRSVLLSLMGENKALHEMLKIAVDALQDLRTGIYHTTRVTTLSEKVLTQIEEIAAKAQEAIK